MPNDDFADSASFRDPSGRIHGIDSRIFRATGFYQELTEARETVVEPRG